jgi:GT2 family glycosyltransferase
MISIISLNWNTTNMMIRLYESLIKTTKNEFNLIIVDNGSRKEELEKLDEYFIEMKNVFIESLPENIGFAAGNNHGLGLVDVIKEKYIFFINSDIIVEENEWDIKLIEVLKREDVGIVGCAYHPLKWTKDARFQIQPIPEIPVESESVQGAFFGIKTEITEELIENGQPIFDEEFKFAHYEETDLQFRIIQLGYKCFFVPCKHIHDHNKSATKCNGYKLNSEIQNEQQFKMNSERNRQRLLEKHKEWFNKK